MKNRFAKLLLLCIAALYPFFVLAETPPETPVVKKPELLLVYWGSADCKWCVYWESWLSGMESGLKKADEFKHLTYRAVKNQRLADPYTLEDFPPDIRWLKESMDRKGEKIYGRPAWWLYVDKVRVAKFTGTKDWDAKILPEIKKVVNRHVPAESGT